MKLNRDHLLILILGAVLFIPFLGQVHLFDWDEINFAEAAREMIRTHHYTLVQINYEPFWEKPPLFIWMQVASMQLFGVNEFAARFPNAVIGIITLLCVYAVGRKLFDRRMGIYWVLTYAGSILPHFYFKSGIIDPTFNLFIFLGIYAFTEFLQHIELGSRSRAFRAISLAGISLGLAVLTKGPVALLIFVLCFLVYQLLRFRKVCFYGLHYLWMALLAAGISSVWVLLVVRESGWGIMQQFLNYQVRLLRTGDAGHSGFLLYHWVVLLLGCFPASLLLFFAFSRKSAGYLNSRQRRFSLWMKVMFWVVLILFTLVKTKIVHYSSLCWFPLTFLAARVLWLHAIEPLRIPRIWSIGTALLTGLLGLILLALPLAGLFSADLASAISDPLTREALHARVSWHAGELGIGLLFLGIAAYGYFFLIRKKELLSGFFLLFAASISMVQLASVDFVPKIEQYSQGSNIRFFESLRGKTVYAVPVNFKSYAQLFYTNLAPPAGPRVSNIDSLIRGRINQDVYFVARNTGDLSYLNHPDITWLYSENGYSYYLRKAGSGKK